MRSAIFAVLAITGSFLIGLSFAGTKVVTKTLPPEIRQVPGPTVYVDKPADTTRIAELESQLSTAQQHAREESDTWAALAKELDAVKAKAAADAEYAANQLRYARQLLNDNAQKKSECQPVSQQIYQRRGILGRFRR